MELGRVRSEQEMLYSETAGKEPRKMEQDPKCNSVFHFNQTNAKMLQSTSNQRQPDEVSTVLGPAISASKHGSFPNDVRYNHMISDRTGLRKLDAGGVEEPPAQKVLRQLQEQVSCHTSQLRQLRQQDGVERRSGGERFGSRAEFSKRGSTGTLPGGCASSSYAGEDTAVYGRRYSVGQTLPQRLPSQRGDGQRPWPAESESLPSLVAKDSGVCEHNCVLRQLDSLVQRQQQQLLEAQMRHPLDMAQLEKIYWEQKKITRVRHLFSDIHLYRLLLLVSTCVKQDYYSYDAL